MPLPHYMHSTVEHASAQPTRRRERSLCDVQIIGVGAAVVGDMSSRPYWGLYELDFVFSTLVVRMHA